MNTYLNPAMEVKLVKQLYRNPNHRQKYRLTVKGRVMKYE